MDGLPATFPDDYDFQWVRLDSTNNPTNVGTNSNTYTVLPADVDSTIRVDVSFTDGAGNLEGPLMSTAVGPVMASLPELSFAESRVDVDETDGTAALTVNLTPASTGQVTVDYATTSDGTISSSAAKAGEDYTAQSDTLTFTAGETSKTITIQITDDDIHEEVELFRVDLTNPSGATVPGGAAGGTAQIYITSDDPEPVASMDDVTVGEGDGTMRLTLQLDRPSTQTITYSTISTDVGGTATASEDYVGLPNDSHTLFEVPAGERTAEFDITIIDDDVAESNETITIGWALGSHSPATPLALHFTGTITDNDGGATDNTPATGQPTISGAARVGEQLTADTGAIMDADGLPATFNYRWLRVDASDNETDIGANSHTYTVLPADVGRTIRVDVSFTDGAGNPEGPLASPETAAVMSPDPGALFCDMSMAPVTVHEGETAEFTITIHPPLPRDDILIWYVHDHGEATIPEDIPSTSGWANLKAGATQVVGAVKTNKDDETEPTEGFQIVMDWASWRARPDWREAPGCTGRIYIRDGESNGAPAFDDDAPTTRKVAENTAPGKPVGKPVTAADPNDDPVTYALEDEDAASFSIDAETGQLRTAAALDHETKDTYTVMVTATDDRGGTATIDVTVNVEDVREPPETPDGLAVSVSGRSLELIWNAPENTGPPMTYDLRYREQGRGWRTDGPRNVDGLSATLDGLARRTVYEVQVLARNDEGASDWSATIIVRTGANAPPVFDERNRTTRNVPENTASGEPIGGPVSAVDPEDDDLTYTLEGEDAGSFRIDSGTGQLRTRAALDHEAKAAYAVTVKADDGEGGTAMTRVTVNVTDVDEPPQAPGAPLVEGSGTSLSVRWIVPANTGPPMTYDLRYRKKGESSWTAGPENVAGRSASLGDEPDLDPDTEYEVQVRADNGEGESGWSASGRGRTGGGGERSVYMADVTVHEGELAEFTIHFSPAKSDDDRLLWFTRDHGSAREGEDFERVSEGIRLKAGQTEVELAVQILEDDEAEAEERFQISISYGDVGDSVEYVGSIYIQDGPKPAQAGAPAAVSTEPPAPATKPAVAEQSAGPRLTARFAAVPAEHDGASKFRFRLVFSDEIFDGAEALDKNKAVRNALAITGGAAIGSRRVGKTEFDEYWIEVRPAGNGPVTISLSPASSCGTSSVTCTPDGRKLSTPISTRVEGPPGLSVADATVREGPGAVLEFGVKLSREPSGTVTVAYATSDGTAQAGADYTAASGTATFAPGETRKTVEVTVLDDAHDEGSETLTLVLSNPSGAYLADGEARGTIENSDPLPQAWLSRFGRSAAVQVVTLLDERFEAAAAAGEARLTLGGRAVDVAALRTLTPGQAGTAEPGPRARTDSRVCRRDRRAGGVPRAGVRQG